MSDNLKHHKELGQLRQSLDKLDKSILNLIFQRFDLVKNIFTVKKKFGLEYKDKNREEEIWDNYWQLWEVNTSYTTKADWPYFSKILKVFLDQSFLQATKFISRKKK